VEGSALHSLRSEGVAYALLDPARAEALFDQAEQPGMRLTRKLRGALEEDQRTSVLLRYPSLSPLTERNHL
jgi:hypothetical protein